MPTITDDQNLEKRLAELESAIATLDGQARESDARLQRLERKPADLPRPPIPRRVSEPSSTPARHEPPVARATAMSDQPARTIAGSRQGPSLSDVFGGRVLAWIGGVATLLGIVLFLALAISRGWIGVEARLALAGIGCCALMAVGAWLHERRGRTEASIVLVAVATSGMFATLVVAGKHYGLIASVVAVGLSMLVGAVATALAIRWAGQAIAVIGLLGALASPVLVGGTLTASTIAILAVGSACAMWTAVALRWVWLPLASVVVSAFQWSQWLLVGQPVALAYGVLVWFAALGLAGAIGQQHRSREGQTDDGRLDPAPAALIVLNAAIVGAIGHATLQGTSGALWLVGLGAAHVLVGILRWRRLPISAPLGRLLIAVGVVLGDVALALTVSATTLAIVWAAAALGFAWLARRVSDRATDETLLTPGVGAHIALALLCAVLALPPTAVTTGTADLVSLLAVGALAASCAACGLLMRARQPEWGTLVNGVGLVAVAYLTAAALSGPALVACWAFEAVTLIQLWKRTGDEVARHASVAFLGLAALHALAVEAPPTALLTGVPSLSAAALALAVIALALVRGARVQAAGSRLRRWLLLSPLVPVLYLASIAIITAFQPTGVVDSSLLDLSVRQEGQVVLSAFWSLVGLTGLIVGLRKNNAHVRNASFALLLVTVAKVFLYDLSTLTSVYRVISVVALGLLLLAGAFAYQRLRPPPAPDLRSLHPSQR